MIARAQSPNRVVVTGMGVLSPNGNDLAQFWASLRDGVSGVSLITRFDADDLSCRIAGEVKNFDPDVYMDHRLKAEKRMSRATQYAIASSVMAIDDAKLKLSDLRGSEPIPIVLGVSTSAMDIIAQPPKPWTPLATCPHSVTSSIAYTTGVQARLWTISDGCTSGMDAVSAASMEIRSGASDIAIAGASDSAITRYTFESFIRSKKLSTRNDAPNEACRPFDLGRDGAVLSEGAGLVVLENAEHAMARGRTPYCEVIGGGMCADPPDSEEGAGMELAMRQALANARCRPDDIDYINAHAPGDPHIDRMEGQLLAAVFEEAAYRTPISSIKGSIGNPMAASSILQFISASLIMQNQAITPTMNLDNPDPECALDHVVGYTCSTPMRTILVNSHGFGRGNNSIVLRGWVP